MITVYVLKGWRLQDKSPDDLSDSEFKELSVAMSLKEFENHFNFNESIGYDNYIRFVESEV